MESGLRYSEHKCYNSLMDLNSEEGSSKGSSDAGMEGTDFTKEEDMQDFTLFRGKPCQDLTLDDLKEVEFNTIEEVDRFYNYYDEECDTITTIFAGYDISEKEGSNPNCTGVPNFLQHFRPFPTTRAMMVHHTVMTVNILTPASKSKHLLSEPASFLQAPILESLRFLLNHIHFANGNFKSAPEDKRKGYFEQVWCELLR